MPYENIAMSPETTEKLISDLWAGSKQAWMCVYDQVVVPALRFRTPKQNVTYYQIIHDRGLDERSLLAMLYKEMIARKKLNVYGYRGNFFSWMRNYVIKAIFDYCEKNPILPDDRSESLVDIADERGKAEEWEIVQACFADLWRANPLRAYVHLLKTREGLSSECIMKMLDISSIANVDQYFSRAVVDMKRLKDIHGQAVESGE